MPDLKDLGSGFGPRLSTVGARLEDYLRSAILNGDLASGTRMTQEELASAFGVSRMPVRDALRQLASQGLVEVLPRGGMVIAEISLKDALDIYGIRVLIEPEALRLSADRLTDEDILQAKNYLLAIQKSSDLREIGQCNLLFHSKLYSRCDRPRLLGLIETHLRAFEKYSRLQVGVDGISRLAQNEHWDLISAIEERSFDRAEDILRAHIRSAAIEVETLFKLQRSKDK